MNTDMSESIFEATEIGQLALLKLGEVPENFRIYVAGIKPEPPKEWTHMEVTGAVFRVAKAGPQKGKLCIMVPGSRQSVRISRTEFQKHKEAAAAPGLV